MPIETLVSIMPLVENRDHWKLRALIAEGKLADLEAKAQKKSKLQGVEVRQAAPDYDADIVSGGQTLYNIWRSATFTLAETVLNARAAVPRIDDRGRLVFDVGVQVDRVGALNANATYDLLKAAFEAKP